MMAAGSPLVVLKRVTARPQSLEGLYAGSPSRDLTGVTDTINSAETYGLAFEFFGDAIFIADTRTGWNGGGNRDCLL